MKLLRGGVRNADHNEQHVGADVLAGLSLYAGFQQPRFYMAVDRRVIGRRIDVGILPAETSLFLNTPTESRPAR